jgi:acetylornithine deacetylase/succinyl-diaminopimelate desuccinylase-like protein
LLPGDSQEEMIGAIERAISDPDVSLDVILRPAGTSSPDYRSPLYEAIEHAVSRHVPGAVTVPALLAGGTDSRYFRAKGAKAYGFEPFVRSQEEEALIHGDNERIRIEELNRALRIYYDLLKDFLG